MTINSYNQAPDSDTIVVTVTRYDAGDDDVVMEGSVTISRDEDGRVFVVVIDGDSETRMILGQEGYTQKL
jgi:hypothetical protein